MNIFSRRAPQGLTALTTAFQTLPPYWAMEGRRRDELPENMRAALEAALQTAQAGLKAEGDIRAFLFDDDDDDTDALFDLDDNGIATINVRGVLLKTSYWWYQSCGTLALIRAIRAAREDERVKAIALFVDSPGGSVESIADAAAEIFAVRGVKPIGAYIQDDGCSAAYWLASQCDFVWCNPTAIVGSIGTITTLDDWSDAFKQMGVKRHVIATGPFKGTGTRGVPVTKAQIDDRQRVVDEFNALFKEGVVRGRGLAAADVDALATGAIHIGANAVGLKLADKVATLDQFYAKLGGAPDAADDQLADEDKNDDQDGGDDDGVGAAAPSPSVPAAGGIHQTSALPDTGEGAPSTTADSGPTAADRGHLAADSGKISREKPMKEKFAALLIRAGFISAGAAVLGAKDDTDDAIVAAAMEGAKSGETAVSAATRGGAPATDAAAPQNGIQLTDAQREILAAVETAGIKAADLPGLVEMADLGKVFSAQVREGAKVQAVRAYGADLGGQLIEQCDKLPIKTLQAMSSGWQAEADKKFGIGANGESAERKSAPAKVAVSAETGVEQQQNKRPWEMLSKDQQKIGSQMGHNTPEKQDKWAAEYLGLKGEEN